MIVICPYMRGGDREAELMCISMRKNSSDNLHIVFTGDAPYIKSHYQHVQYKSKLPTKESRVADQLKAAIDSIKPERFILTNDDIFALSFFSVENMPLYYSGKTAEQIKRYPSGNVYKQTLMNSIVSDEDLFFAVHYPMPIHDVNLFYEKLEETIKTKRNSFRNLYGNAYISANETARIEKVSDCKLFSPGKPEVFLNHAKNNAWVSVGDGYWSNHENRKTIIEYISKQ